MTKNKLFLSLPLPGTHRINIFSRDNIFVTIVFILSVSLFFLPNNKTTGRSVTASARVLQMTDSTQLIGDIRIGKQNVVAKILSGPYRDQEIKIQNTLVGYILTDRYFKKGDRALLILDISDEKIRKARLLDYDRKNIHLMMVTVFIGLLIVFARSIGIRSLVSFLFTVVILVKFLFPLILSGYDPLVVCLSFSLIFGIVTLLLVGGFSIRTFSAIMGFTIGIFLTAALTIVVGKGMYLRGISCDWAVFLLQSGYPGLDLTGILLGSIILGASGAMIDIAISVATSVREVAGANPVLGLKKLIQSGFAVGRIEMGTMTTTLLLSYMGVNMFLIVLFTTKGTSMAEFLNINMISHEILRALAGSIGMVLIAPLTAITAGLFYHRDSTHP